LRPPPCIAATWLTGDRCVPSRQRHLSGCCARHTTARPSTARAPSNAFAAAAPERVANAPALAVASSRCAAAVAVRAWAWRARRAFLCGSALQMMLADPRRVMLLRTFLQRRDGATPARFAVAAHTPPPSTAMFRRRTFSLAAAAALGAARAPPLRRAVLLGRRPRRAHPRCGHPPARLAVGLNRRCCRHVTPHQPTKTKP